MGNPGPTTVSGWGLAPMTLLLLAAGTLVLRRLPLAGRARRAMYSNPVNKTFVTALAVGVSLAAVRSATADAIIPVAQNRSVSNENVNAPQCSNDFFFDEDAAAGFEPFDAFVETEHSCDSGSAFAFASQQSQIGAASMAGSGSATSEASGPVPGHVHAFGISFFEVTFEVPSASAFTLDGVISASAVPDPSVGVVAKIKLTDPGGALIFDHTVQAVPASKTKSQVIEEGGVLEPGLYTLQAQAGTFMKNGVPPTRSAEASFAFTFGASPPGDIPTVSQWGIIVMAPLLLTTGTLVLRRSLSAGHRESRSAEFVS